MSELEERLNAVLSDPGELDRLAKMARQLMGGSPEPDSPASGGLPAGAAALLRSLRGGGHPPLLDAVGPYLDEGRRERLGRALRLASAAKAALPALREMGGLRGL